MKGIARQFALWLLGIVRKYLDPDFKKDLDAYEAERKALEEKLAKSRAEIAELDKEVAGINARRAKLSEEVEAARLEFERLEKERKQVNNEGEKKQAIIGNLSDRDAVRGDLV